MHNVEWKRRSTTEAWRMRKPVFSVGECKSWYFGEAECRSSWAEEGLRTYREKILIVLERTWREKDYNCLWKDLIKRDYFIVTERTWWKETILWWLKGLGEKRPFVVVERTWGKRLLLAWKNFGEKILVSGWKHFVKKDHLVVVVWLWKWGGLGLKPNWFFLLLDYDTHCYIIYITLFRYYIRLNVIVITKILWEN